MRIIPIFVLLAAAAATAQAPKGFDRWKSADLRAFERSLSPKINAQKVAVQDLANWGNHTALMAHREGDGEAELHETQNDLTVIESGEATLVVGGIIVNPRTTAPHEVRGPSIEGGERIAVSPGDVFHIPIKTPHQMLVAKGHQVTYFVVKIDAH